MAVVVDEFEVVPGAAPAPPQGAPQAAAAATPADPVKAEEDLERATRRLHLRVERLRAT